MKFDARGAIGLILGSGLGDPGSEIVSRMQPSFGRLVYIWNQ